MGGPSGAFLRQIHPPSESPQSRAGPRPHLFSAPAGGQTLPAGRSHAAQPLAFQAHTRIFQSPHLRRPPPRFEEGRRCRRQQPTASVFFQIQCTRGLRRPAGQTPCPARQGLQAPFSSRRASFSRRRPEASGLASRRFSPAQKGREASFERPGPPHGRPGLPTRPFLLQAAGLCAQPCGAAAPHAAAAHRPHGRPCAAHKLYQPAAAALVLLQKRAACRQPVRCGQRNAVARRHRIQAVARTVFVHSVQLFLQRHASRAVHGPVRRLPGALGRQCRLRFVLYMSHIRAFCLRRGICAPMYPANITHLHFSPAVHLHHRSPAKNTTHFSPAVHLRRPAPPVRCAGRRSFPFPASARPAP